MSQSTPTPDTIARTETAETVTVPRDHAWWLTVARLAGEHGVRYRTNSALVKFLDGIPAVSPQHPVGVREAPERAEEERDALLKALNFKPGPLEDNLSRRVILEDAAGLRPAMAKAREAESRAEFAAASAALELDEIRAELLSGQGDDDGLQILPDFEEGQSVLQMVCKCIALLETRRDVVEGYEAEAKSRATISHPPAQDAPGVVKVKALAWERLNEEAMRATTEIGRYELWQDGLGQWHSSYCGDDIQVDITLSEARESPQADYDRRILAALDPSPPLPEADGEVVAQFREDLAGYERDEYGMDQLVTLIVSLLERTEQRAVSALRERDEARAELRDEHLLHVGALRERNEERAAREKAEQVAAGLREIVKRGYEGWSNVVELGLLPPQHVSTAEEIRDLFGEALRASTEKGKTANPSVTDEEAGRG